MNITVLILKQETSEDGAHTASGVAEQFGAEVRWEAWKGVGDATWSVRLPTGLEQGELELVDGDGVLDAIRHQLVAGSPGE